MKSRRGSANTLPMATKLIANTYFAIGYKSSDSTWDLEEKSRSFCSVARSSHTVPDRAPNIPSTFVKLSIKLKGGNGMT